MRDTCYPSAAFQFVLEGLAFSTDRARELSVAAGLPEPDLRHITGQQLCMGLHEYAIDRFGMLAPCVLSHWNIVRTEDFGRIVYALIAAGRLDRSSDDSIDDFRSVFEFDEAFSRSAMATRIAVH